MGVQCAWWTVLQVSNSVGDVAWYDGNSDDKTHDVCGKQANGYGLCDMSGNVWEWVWDWEGSFESSSSVDPTGPTSGTQRLIRGGSWDVSASFVRVYFRYGWKPSDIDNGLGFRLARSSHSVQ